MTLLWLTALPPDIWATQEKNHKPWNWIKKIPGIQQTKFTPEEDDIILARELLI